MATSSDYEVRDEDRLPWLETVDEDYDEGPSVLRVILMVLLGLAIIAAAIFGYYWYKKQQGSDGNGALIAAQEGDYKVKPDDPGGMNVTGEGDTAIATSDGAGAGNASIDLNATPETPVAGAKVAPAAPAAGGASKAVAVIPPSGGKLAATTPALAPAAGPSAGGALVQLGSFPDEGSANAAWARAAKRFTYLAPLGKSVQKAEVNGRTVYRLRVNAGSANQATELCGKLKVAGEACFVANN
ncbi:MAG: SPOR domain-containing protein [Pseudomonadota bacterium]